MELQSRYDTILRRIKTAAASAGRPHESVILIAVSKNHPAERLEELYRLGHRNFGESYAQEMIEKARLLQARGCEGIRWHFIGHLQTNKVKLLVPWVHAVHSLDSERLARELAKRWQGRPPLSVFIEVNADGESSKSGVPPNEVRGLCAAISQLPELEVAGLMCIPSPNRADPAEAFRQLKDLEAQCRPITHGQLSMGMTDDFEVAIREGATHVRVGTAIFGERPTHPVQA